MSVHISLRWAPVWATRTIPLLTIRTAVNVPHLRRAGNRNPPLELGIARLG